jgi:hypothetical protein
VQESAAFDSTDSFALRVKYGKHTVSLSIACIHDQESDSDLIFRPSSFQIPQRKLFIPVEPSTSYDKVISRALSILVKSDAIPPEESGFTSFQKMTEKDAALFQGSSSTAGGAFQESMRYMEIDRIKQDTVSKMGFKDGPEALTYVGFRQKGRKSKSGDVCM